MGSSAPRAAGEPEDSFLGTYQTNTTFKMPKKANIFESFSHSAIQQFKEAFGIMDTDKDGLLSSSDLVAAFAAHGKSIGGGDAQAMLDPPAPQKRAPGMEFLGKRAPGMEFLGKRAPGMEFVGKRA